MLREVDVGWGWEVYVEMFLAGIAAGAYLAAGFLEWRGRGRSPIARAAHLLTLPLILIATGLLILKLERSERFWHMVIQSERIPLPMFKWWAPISLGTWGLMLFSAFALVSFLDALIARDWLRLGPWRRGRALHGTVLGLAWATGGGLAAVLVGAYAGALLSVNALPGWADTVLIGPFFLAISAATGVAALLLIEAFRRAAPADEVAALERAGLLLLAWQMVLLVVLAVSLGGALLLFFSSLRTIAAAIAGLLLGLAALALLAFKPLASAPTRHGLAAALALASGFLLRYLVVMGPQHAISS